MRLYLEYVAIYPLGSEPGQQRWTEEDKNNKETDLGRDGEALTACGEHHALNRLNEKDH